MSAREVCRNARHSAAPGRLPMACADALGTARHSVRPLSVFAPVSAGLSAVPAVSAHPGTAPRAVTAAEVCRRCRSLRTGTRHTPHTRPGRAPRLPPTSTNPTHDARTRDRR